MTREEYKAKLKGLHAQMDCDLRWEYTKEYIASLEARIAELEAMHDHQHLLNLADEAVATKKRIAELEAGNAILDDALRTACSALWIAYPKGETWTYYRDKFMQQAELFSSADIPAIYDDNRSLEPPEE